MPRIEPAWLHAVREMRAGLGNEVHSPVTDAREQSGLSRLRFASPNDPAAPMASRSVNQALRRWSIRHDVPDFQARDLRRTCKTMLADYLEADEGLMARTRARTDTC